MSSGDMPPFNVGCLDRWGHPVPSLSGVTTVFEVSCSLLEPTAARFKLTNTKAYVQGNALV